MRHITYNDPVAAEETSFTAVEIDHLSSKVRFSLRHCSTDRKHCIKNVARDSTLLKCLYKQLGHLEDLTWQQIVGIDRREGISIEKKDQPNYAMMAKEFPGFKTYGHFRVSHPTLDKFRVFGAISDGLFCILKFDPEGKANH